jgi:hypothetical protein
MGTGSFMGVERGRGVTLTPHPFLMPRSKHRVELIPLLSLRVFVACNKGKPYQKEGPQRFHESRSHIKIPGTRRVRTHKH